LLRHGRKREIEGDFPINGKIVARHCQVPRNETKLRGAELDCVGGRNIVYTEKTLVTLLEFLVVKYLDCDHGRLSHFDLESFIPHWAKGPPNDSSCAGLLSVHGEHGEGVWKTE
jgi:hypothetical protein